MKNMTVEAFTALTESKSASPGGGSVAALTGALAAALTGMVANLTKGRKKYIQYDEEMVDLEKKAKSLSIQLLNSIQEDSDSFDLYMKALKLPKETSEEKKIRKEAMESGLKEAIRVPYHTAELAYSVLELAEVAVARGNQNAVTDGKAGVILACAAIDCAILNVRINLESIKDEQFSEKYEREVSIIETDANRRKQEILNK